MQLSLKLLALFAVFTAAQAQSKPKCGGADVTSSGGGKPDGVVNIEDLIGLLSAYGSTKAKDKTFDIKKSSSKQSIDIEDLLLLLENFGQKNCKADSQADKLKKCCKNGVKDGKCVVGSGMCNRMYRPVCGCDGKTYSNSGCAGKTVNSLTKTNGGCGSSGGGGPTLGRPFLTADMSHEWGVKALVATATADTAADWIGL